MTAQAVVERGMLDGIGDAMMRVRYAVESRFGEGSVKWLLLAGAVLLVFWAFRRR
jgi:hypothetical protein